MNLSLILLLATMVVMSQQQRSAILVQDIGPNYPTRNFHYHYPFYAPEEEDDPSQQMIQSMDWLIQSRGMNNRLPISNDFRRPSPSQKRFFFGGGNDGFNPSANPFSIFFRTTVTTATSTSYIATPVFVTCIPTAQFSANAAGVTCPQKKRHARQLLLDNGEDIISPSGIQRLVPTAVTTLTGTGPARSAYEVVPSFDDHRQNRAFFNFAVTLTSTTTVYQFNATTVKRTVAPAASASGLSCLPAGFVLC